MKLSIDEYCGHMAEAIHINCRPKPEIQYEFSEVVHRIGEEEKPTDIPWSDRLVSQQGPITEIVISASCNEDNIGLRVK